MKISININGVLRNVLLKFEEVYEKDNTIGILDKDVRAYADAFENSSDDITGVRDFCDAVLTGLNNLEKLKKN